MTTSGAGPWGSADPTHAGWKATGTEVALEVELAE